MHGKYNILLIIIGLMALFWLVTKTNQQQKTTDHSIEANLYSGLSASKQLYFLICNYSEQYNVPPNIAFGVAKKESGYKGVYHKNYNPHLISSAKAYGAMQIQLQTARSISKKYHITNKNITEEDLLNDIELNVHISMAYLSHLYQKYGSWGLALGSYNTGTPVVNGFANDIINFNPHTDFDFWF